MGSEGFTKVVVYVNLKEDLQGWMNQVHKTVFRTINVFAFVKY